MSLNAVTQCSKSNSDPVRVVINVFKHNQRVKWLAAIIQFNSLSSRLGQLGAGLTLISSLTWCRKLPMGI